MILPKRCGYEDLSNEVSHDLPSHMKFSKADLSLQKFSFLTVLKIIFSYLCGPNVTVSFGLHIRLFGCMLHLYSCSGHMLRLKTHKSSPIVERTYI